MAKTAAFYSQAVTSPDSVARYLTRLVGSTHQDEQSGNDLEVMRVLQFQVVNFQGSIYVVALTEVEPKS